jgi:hypothetical protein
MPTVTAVVEGAGLRVTVADSVRATDWIGVYTPGAAEVNPKAWCYLDGTQVPPGAPIAPAVRTFPLAPGTYEGSSSRCRAGSGLARPRP